MLLDVSLRVYGAFLMQHKQLWLKDGKRRRTYCACGWLQSEWCERVDSAFENSRDAQNAFIEHLAENSWGEKPIDTQIWCQDCGESLKHWDDPCSCDGVRSVPVTKEVLAE